MIQPPQGPRNLQLFGSKVFIGERLTQAREAQGLTMTSLAQRVGKSKQAISRYEASTDNPSSEVVLLLADTLEQPAMFFYQPMRPNEGAEVTFYRRLKSVKAMDLRRVSAWRHWLEDLTILLEEYVDFPDLDLPQYDFPVPPSEAISFELIESMTLAIRKHWRLGNGPIEHVVRTFEHNGILVGRFDVGADDVDAYSFRSSNNRSIIALNNFKTNYFRSRFDACHELAHLVLHRDIKKEDLDDSRIYERIERQAHRFASALLLPAEPLLKDATSANLDDLLILKEKWGVSVGGIAHRLLDLGVISKDEHIRIRKNLARRGWLRGEPLDLSTSSEKPIAIKQALKALIEEAEFTKNDILTDLARSPYIIEELANLPPSFFSISDDVELEIKNQNLSMPTG